MENEEQKMKIKYFIIYLLIFVENEQTFCYILQDNCLHYESTHS
jgi:hypothetical protein